METKVLMHPKSNLHPTMIPYLLISQRKMQRIQK
ncbi:unnamed protein product [Onchocerca flexuosa]|uniref:Uncharacterized protein n=1 Tax=Onchocerca flexuosa TaxID=387005 RepID=A0A183HF61_9BILA|nr:unnamed protein product [Onchocerca flexuosa]